ncbi:MAG: serine/threonine-protein kinase, partial [Acidobacteria bacterium]
MGEVYRAHDAKLKRDVALKVLPEAFANDAERMARFEREAQLLASLNHPNIAAIYGLEQSDNLFFLVLELVPGETLAERLQRGPLPVSEALELARQISDAVAAAHDNGVIHRDLKPANIKITPDGQIKVLDFGLARFAEAEPDATGEGVSDSPTLSAHATRVGVILGTAAYMSPEQARGRTVDKRTDIFSFGAVLYEMLTGRQLFKGEDVADTMASVMRSEPDFHALPTELHPRVLELLSRCLEKDPKKRRRDIGDLRADLERPLEPLPMETHERRRPAWLAVVGVALLMGVTAMVTWNLKPERPRRIQRFEIALPEGDIFGQAARRHIVALSPQGTHLVYAANEQLHLRTLDQAEVVPIRGTEGAREPFFSPDGQWIGFWADGYLKKVALSGGAVMTLCEAANPYGASWMADDTIVFGQGPGGIWEVAANGGEPRVLVAGGEGRAHGPQKLPDGKSLLFTFTESKFDWDEANIVVANLDTGERKTLIRVGRDARYLPTGHLVYAVESTLFAVPFDVGKLELMGDPAPVLEGVLRSVGGSNGGGASQFSFSQDGSLAFVRGSVGVERSLLWVERDGQWSAITERKGTFSHPRLSPNGKRLAITILKDGINDVWILDIERDTLTQLTTGGVTGGASWSPDAEWLAAGMGLSNASIFRIRSDFSGLAELVLERRGARVSPYWMPDAAGLIFQENVGSNAEIWVLPLEGDGEPHPLLQSESGFAQPSLSPDGRWIAYHSDVSGRTQKSFVQPFPGLGGREQISIDGGRSPLWSPAGREIFYTGDESRSMMAVAIRTEPELEVGQPQRLFEWPD